MLQTRNLTFAYDAAHTFNFPDIDCPAGKHRLIIGESGHGKTTLLHLLAGLRRPNSKSSTVTIGDTDITKLSDRKLDRFRGQHIGLVFQTAHFVASLSVGENLLLAQSLAGLKPDRPRARNLLERLRLGNEYDKLPRRLSIGEQQRVAIARALINQPRIILADEPSSSLDDTNTEQVINLLTEQADEVGANLIIVTHDQRLKNRFDERTEL